MHFVIAQATVGLLSLLVIILFYKNARRLVPAPLGELIAISLIAVGIAARTFFSLFSLIRYTPAVHLAAIGLLTMMWATIWYIDDGRSRIAKVALGAWCACLSEQEAVLASAALFALLAIFDRRLYS